MSKLDFKNIYENIQFEKEYGITNEKITEKSLKQKLIDRLSEYLRKIPGQKMVEFVAKATGKSPADVFKSTAKNTGGNLAKATDSIFSFIKDKTKKLASTASNAIDNAARTDDEKAQYNKEQANKQDEESKKEKENLKTKDLNLDSHKTTFSCIFDHGDAAKLEKIVEDINTEKEKSVKLVNDIAKRLPEELKKRGVDDISKEDIDKYGMAIAGLIAKGYKKDKLKKAIDQIKNQTNESLTEAQLNESALMTGINMALSLVGVGVGNNNDYLDSFSSVITNSDAMGNETTKVVEKFMHSSKFSMDGVSGAAETAAAGTALWVLAGLKALKVLIRHRKDISEIISNQYNKFEKNANVIASMSFIYDDTKYKVNYKVNDNKWIIVDADNPKEEVEKDILKSALDSDLGKKFRKYCKDIWDPIFKGHDGNDSMFMFIIKNNDELKLKLKLPKQLRQIGEQYDRIEKTCTSDSYNI